MITLNELLEVVRIDVMTLEMDITTRLKSRVFVNLKNIEELDDVTRLFGNRGVTTIVIPGYDLPAIVEITSYEKVKRKEAQT